MPPKNKGKGKDDSKGEGGKGSSVSSKLKPATSINVRHILCEKHSKKEEALEKIRNGAKFDDVAREMSEDKARAGGSLGWKVRGSLLQDFEKVAYELEPSTTGSPKIGEVKTGEGYHIIMVEGRK
jgi:NIMA-interacting peptidyl-prolyl cis-trans isomerase 4